MNAIAVAATGVARRMDRVVLATLVLLALIGILIPPEQALWSYRFAAENLMGIAPFLLASAVAAAYLGAAGAEGVIGRAFSGHPVAIIVTASVFGALSPFCSCGVIPLIAALLAAGVPLPAVMAFWLSSPIMDPEMFLITAGGLGIEFAVVKTVAAMGFGLLGGFATLAVQGAGGFANPLKAEVGCGCGCGPSALGKAAPRWAFWHEEGRRAEFRKTFLWTVGFLGKWLLLAFVLESLMVLYLPAEDVAQWLGGGSIWAIPLATLIGVPAYMNGYAAVPLVAGLMQSGMDAGAALAFMTAGAVTSIPAAIAVYALVRLRIFGFYLLLAAIGSMLAGAAYQFYLT